MEEGTPYPTVLLGGLLTAHLRMIGLRLSLLNFNICAGSGADMLLTSLFKIDINSAFGVHHHMYVHSIVSSDIHACVIAVFAVKCFI